MDTRNRELETLNRGLEEQNAVLAAKVHFYEEQARLFAHRQYAPSSERTPAGQEAFDLLFNEAEASADPSVPEPSAESADSGANRPRGKRPKGHRQNQLSLLETREIEYPLPEDKQVCSCCGGKLHFVGWQETEKVEAEPAKAIRILYKEGKYACRNCQNEGEPAPIKAAGTMPKLAFPKSIASPSLVAYILHEKFVMSSPLYRQEQNIDRLGLIISRQTMANWVMEAAAMVAPVNNRMHELLILRDIIHADETTVQVLKEPGRSATTDSTMWLYRSGRDGPPIALYDYQTSRAGAHAKRFLQGFGGYDAASKQIVKTKYLQTDGHDGYDAVPHWILDRDRNEKVPDIISAGCWSHARRKFDEANAVVKKEDRKDGRKTVAEEGLEYCNDLFRIERELQDATSEQRFAARQERSKPIIDRCKKWLDRQAIQVLPKSTLGKAIAYCLNQWPKLIVFLQDGRLEIDNNRAERSIKPFVIGRKNWLFANTPNGAKASAALYSIIETAKENGLKPFEYLTYLFERLTVIDTKAPEAIDRILPWAESIPETCRQKHAATS
ncbi:MAG: IS66 family transposase [Capsulimonadaceae bacterium]